MTLHLLIVEADPSALAGLAQAVGQLCEELVVVTALRGQEGLYLISTVPFQVVLYDLGIPDLPGLQLLKEIKRRSADVLVFLTTSQEDPEMRREAIRLGAADLLVRPIPSPVLMTLIDRARRRYTRSDLQIEYPVLGPAVHRAAGRDPGSRDPL